MTSPAQPIPEIVVRKGQRFVFKGNRLNASLRIEQGAIVEMPNIVWISGGVTLEPAQAQGNHE